uniref:Endo/exonuclease/phosphatase domain-containing protein n=1 Tax=Macrostomum lignano TaxID=282301 RepID=A0A1I8JEZ3_9PLAT
AQQQQEAATEDDECVQLLWSSNQRLSISAVENVDPTTVASSAPAETVVGEGDGGSSGRAVDLPSVRKRRKAEVLLSSLKTFSQSDPKSNVRRSSSDFNCADVIASQSPATTVTSTAAQRLNNQTAWHLRRHHQAGCSTCRGFHALPAQLQHRPHAMAYISRTSGSAYHLLSNPVSLDLSQSAMDKGVRAEVAFTGSNEPATSAAAAAAAATAAHLARYQQSVKQQLQQQQPFVQVQNPLCVPRHSDYLASWRTCMVPIVDLEQFAQMKPPCPKWRHLASKSASSVLLFTLMCYNILSDQYASSKSYWYCPPWALAWSFRRQGILENISAQLPTVVCLQEVETEQYYSFFLPHLTRRGYDGIFSPKSRAKTMDDRLRKRVDGCAIFWKRSEFRLVEEHVIEFSQHYLEHCWTQQQQPSQEESQPPSPGPQLRGKASSEIFNRVTVRDNIALSVVLAPVAKGQANSCLMVCTSHMHWDPQHSDVKLIQTVVLTSALAAKIKQFRANTGAASLPWFCAAISTRCPTLFLNRGSVERDHPEFRRLGRDPSLDGLKLPDNPASSEDPAAATTAAASSSSNFSHSLDLASCYSGVDMTYTNYTHEFKGVIDYIFASKRHFRVLDCLEGVTDWLRSGSVIGCPHPYIPSDHIPLAVRLELLPVS